MCETLPHAFESHQPKIRVLINSIKSYKNNLE